MNEVITVMQARIDELEAKLATLTEVFMKMSELYIDASYRLKAYEEMDKAKRINE